MNRFRVGAWAWIATAVYIPAQIVAAVAWPRGYSPTVNAISDLGVTVCGKFGERGALMRDVCSPLHQVFNAGMVVSGALTLLGAVTLFRWWHGLTGRIGMIGMGVTGIGVIVAGLVPWDVNADLHDLGALLQAVAQWAAMCCVAVAAGRGWFRWTTLATVVASVVGFVAFIAAIDGSPVPILGYGIAERMAFDLLAAWTVIAGLTILRRREATEDLPQTVASRP